MAEEKTNVMRILDQKRVPYTPHHYAHPNGAVDGASVAALLDRDPASVCKTLVTQGASGGPGCGREVHRDDPSGQAAPSHRLRPRGLLPGGDEKAFSHRAGRERGRTGRHRGQRRENRSPGGAGSGGPSRRYPNNFSSGGNFFSAFSSKERANPNCKGESK